MMMCDDVFNIRLTGVPPPAAPTAAPTAAPVPKKSASKSKSRKSSSTQKKQQQQQQQQQLRHVMSIPSNMTIAQLEEEAMKLFGVTKKHEEEEYQVVFMNGYPPKPLVLHEEEDDDDDEDASKKEELTLVRNVLQKNENLIVRFLPADKTTPKNQQQQQNNNNKKESAQEGEEQHAEHKARSLSLSLLSSQQQQQQQEQDEEVAETLTTSPSKRPPKRKTALEATQSFPHLIRQQNALLASEQKNNTNKKKKTRDNDNKNQSGGGDGIRGNVVGLSKHASAAAGSSSSAKAAAAAAAAKTRPRKQQQQPQIPPAGNGRRLHDGAPVIIPTSSSTAASSSLSSSSSSSSSRRGKPLFNKQMSNEDDISISLLTCLEKTPGSGGGGGGGGGKIGKVLRRAMKNTLLQSYERTRAIVRVNAVQSGKFTMEPLSSSSSSCSGANGGGGIVLGGGTTNNRNFVGTHVVRYDKGLEGRGQYAEHVEILTKPMLDAVIRTVYAASSSSISNHTEEDDDDEDEEEMEKGASTMTGKEVLRPQNMAQLSPRVFWSVVYHDLYSASQATTTTTTTTRKKKKSTTSVEEALKSIAPNLNWNFLYTGRIKTLSAKAKENLRQERSLLSSKQKGKDQKEEEEGFETRNAQDAIQAVEMAMEQMYTINSSNRRECMARAALARLGGRHNNDDGSDGNDKNIGSKERDGTADTTDANNTAGGDDWTVTTPTEIDTDELKECITEGLKSLVGMNDKVDIVMMNEWVQELIDKCRVHNWRELANTDPNELCASMSLNDVDEIVMSLSRSSSSSSSTSSPCSNINGGGGITKEQMVESWIEQAQTRTIDEIMLEILDGEEEVLVLLREEGCAGTPKDLSLWLDVPELLLEEVPSLKMMMIGEKENVGVGASGTGTGGDGPMKKDDKSDGLTVTKEDVKKWCQRARTALDTLEWLDCYVTPAA